jgi:hypothetical protein
MEALLMKPVWLMENVVKSEVKYLLSRNLLFLNMYLVGLLIFIMIIPKKFIYTDYIRKDWAKKYKLDSRN